MSSLLVIVPSRGRPDSIRRLRQAWRDTEATADLLVCCDDDDPSLADYEPPTAVAPRTRLGPTLNHYAFHRSKMYRYLGFMGDDHLPRTIHWDRLMRHALDELGTGIVYGDDGHQHERLPTAVCMTSDIVATLGYMVPAGLTHMYIDNAWKDWGEGADCLRYLPEVSIEHLHPAAAKAEWDEGYAQADARYPADERAYQGYRENRLAEDIEAIRRLRAGTSY